MTREYFCAHIFAAQKLAAKVIKGNKLHGKLKGHKLEIYNKATLYMNHQASGVTGKCTKKQCGTIDVYSNRSITFIFDICRTDISICDTGKENNYH